MDRVDVSVVVPLYNEEETLVDLHSGLGNALEPRGQPWEVVFVDDGSTDRSWEVLRRLHESDPGHVAVVRLRGRFGKSAALLAGFRHARGAVVITTDADLQDDPAEVPALLDSITAGHDVVCGWRKVRHDPPVKVLTSRLFNLVTSVLTGVWLHDHNTGLKAIRAAALVELDLYGELHRFIPALLARRHFRVGEVIVRHHARRAGITKYGLERFVNGLLDLLTVVFLSNYLRTPLHLFGRLGLVCGGTGFFVCLGLTYVKVMTGTIYPHYPMLFLGLLLVIVGVQFVSTGLLGELLVKASLRESDRYAVTQVLRGPMP